MHKKDSYCRVCGFESPFLPWGADGKSPSWEICPCCGTEFGYEDCSVQSARKKRAEWVKNGMKWFKERARPENWNFDDQAINIPDDFV